MGADAERRRVDDPPPLHDPQEIEISSLGCATSQQRCFSGRFVFGDPSRGGASLKAFSGEAPIRLVLFTPRHWGLRCQSLPRRIPVASRFAAAAFFSSRTCVVPSSARLTHCFPTSFFALASTESQYVRPLRGRRRALKNAISKGPRSTLLILSRVGRVETKM